MREVRLDDPPYTHHQSWFAMLSYSMSSFPSWVCEVWQPLGNKWEITGLLTAPVMDETAPLLNQSWLMDSSTLHGGGGELLSSCTWWQISGTGSISGALPFPHLEWELLSIDFIFALFSLDIDIQALRTADYLLEGGAAPSPLLSFQEAEKCLY